MINRYWGDCTENSDSEPVNKYCTCLNPYECDSCRAEMKRRLDKYKKEKEEDMSYVKDENTFENLENIKKLVEQHPTEIKFPKQTEEFKKIIEKMYEIHLDKNADYCLDGKTKVLTSDLLWVPIENLKIDDTIIGFDEEVKNKKRRARRMYRPAVVENVEKVQLPSYKIFLENGDTIIASEEHSWLTPWGNTSRWIKTKNLRPLGTRKDDYGSVLIKALDTWETLTSYEAGYLAGAFDGEGSLSQIPDSRTIYNSHKRGVSFSLSFAQKNNAMLKYMISILDKFNINYTNMYQDNTKRVNEIRLLKPRRDVIKFIGQIRPKRLLDKLNCSLGMVDLRQKIKVIGVEYIGIQELIGLRTSTKTFLADGYASHNSPSNITVASEIGVLIRLWDKFCRLCNLNGLEFPAIGPKIQNLIDEYENKDKYPVEEESAGLTTPISFLNDLKELKRQAEFDFNNVKPKSPKNESVEDAWLDAAVYAIIGLLNRRGVWGR